MEAKRKHNKRHRIGDATDWRCFYCDTRVRCGKCDPHVSIRSLATLEHVVPRCHGGSYEDRNIVLACYPCNNARGCKGVSLTGRQLHLMSSVRHAVSKSTSNSEKRCTG